MEPIRTQYEKYGVENFYLNQGKNYRNPHEEGIIEGIKEGNRIWNFDLRRILDLACGSGEATLVFQDIGCKSITATDPFTGKAFKERVGFDCLSFSFEDIIEGVFDKERFTLIVCSFAMHLLDKSKLMILTSKLAFISDFLLILTPHKRPIIKSQWKSWFLIGEFVNKKRVRVRYYSSLFLTQNFDQFLAQNHSNIIQNSNSLKTTNEKILQSKKISKKLKEPKITKKEKKQQKKMIKLKEKLNQKSKEKLKEKPRKKK
ncbi:methyltransferase [Anaeramoeba ignava]|uniref:Methyltransferase n=1 Tax=Anaeramoeba ignava TaxID=1746090 RepID=A0A9Q0REP0_ANAIG|nr:methyltransferase [Anaeramoeba ignava]